ncbi:glycosylated lysosomal membrane protein B isoform X2 [Patella vulgata]|uniref:glycosylated lysosomal membrane protein B isoform X2 n=1 Tax=Patella vulgata TaxID=6465 RepID=UPI00217F3B90|nr:glycosylated lysosomal membrane protein B isoform X2 [Patella vulgata]
MASACIVKMKFASLLIVLWYFATSLCLAKEPSNARKITTRLNPDCDVPECQDGYNGSYANIAHIKAVGSEDTLHYVISTIGVPSVVVIRADPTSSLSFNWKNLLSDNATDRSGSITLTGTALKNSFAVVFTELIEYNDVDDKATISSYFHGNTTTTNYTIHDFGEMMWSEVATVPGNKNSAIFSHTVFKNDSDVKKAEGFLSFTFNAYDNTGRQSVLPKMEYNMNNTLLDLLLNNLTAMYDKSRFSVGVVMIGTSQDKPDITETRSLDDEYTPGVFKMFDWSTKPCLKEDGGYLEWKPICYTSSSRNRLSGTYVNSDDRTDGMNQKHYLERSVAYSYFGDKLFSADMTTSGTNISFGLSEDGFYVKKNYTVWSATIGHGTPPQDAISILVIGVISAGLGLPVVIILFGGIFVIVKKHMAKKDQVMGNFSNSYSQINS